MPWVGQFKPLFVLMRKWQEKATQYHDKHCQLRPPYGTVGIGSADMAPFFCYTAVSEFLSVLRKGGKAKEAAEGAKAAAKESIEKWNRQGCKGRAFMSGQFELHYWVGHCDTLIGTMEREFTALEKES